MLAFGRPTRDRVLHGIPGEELQAPELLISIRLAIEVKSRGLFDVINHVEVSIRGAPPLCLDLQKLHSAMFSGNSRTLSNLTAI